jgi:hypothetical protein
MALSQKQVDKIVKDKTHFEVGLDVNDGKAVWIDGKWVEEDEKGEIIEVKEAKVDPTQILYVRYNEDVDRRIRDFLPRVLNQRGVTEPSDIEVSHPHVQSKIREIRKAPGRNRRSFTEEDNIKVIEMVRKAHRPQYMVALMQVILWAMVYDDLFKLANTGKGVSLDIKFDFEVPEDYWTLQNNNDKDALLLELVTDAWKVEFKRYDRNNPLEMMLAFATTLLEHFPEIGENIGILQSNVVTAFTFASGGAQFDDAGFLIAELDELLRRPILRKHNIKQRENSVKRVRTDDGENKTETIVGE